MDEMKDRLQYIIITPAYNEESNIENTILSVISQSQLPLKWVIVSDGSTDRTDEIIQKYSKSCNWIEFIRMPEHKDRQFAAKVYAFEAGYKIIEDLRFDIIGNLDADITFESDYFRFLLDKFEADPKLGVAGTPFVENGRHYDYRFTNIEHVSGACQLFRRECFHEIGGYQPIRWGGIDWTAVTSARMKGWHTRTYTEKVCHHHRKIGSGNSNLIGVSFKQGRKDYFLGGHPLWQVFRSIYQMKNKPYFIGGILLLSGYLWGSLSRIERPISKDLMEFIRKEQMMRLKKILLHVRII